MDERNRKYIWRQIDNRLCREIADEICDDVCTDIEESANPEWNWPDVDIAINRVLMKRLGINKG